MKESTMPDNQRLRILIAEDEESFLRVLTSVLEATGRFTVYSCESGEEAIEGLKRSRFDVVILDYKMPGMSGLNVLQWMHEQKSTIPVMILTGAGSESIAVESMKLGAYDYMRKDQFDREHFPIIVQGIHERHMFKEERERREDVMRERERNVATFELIGNSLNSFVQILHTTMQALERITNEGERTLISSGDDQTTEVLTSYFRNVRKELKTVHVLGQSINQLSTTIQNHREEMQKPADSGHVLSPQVHAEKNKAPQRH